VRWECVKSPHLVISKDCGKRGKRLHVFLSFHQAVISTAPSLSRENFIVGHVFEKPVLRTLKLLIVLAWMCSFKWPKGCEVGQWIRMF
jgi:hypothetical protein